jgi:hypothetical protein
MRLHGFILFIAAFFCTALNGSAQTDNPAERIFYNAKIFTAEPKHPYAEAVAIRGDKIIAVGSHADATKAVGGGAESIDLHGKRLLPGLIDSHVHPILGGFILSSPDAGDDKVRSVADLAVVVTEAAKNGRGMHGDIFMINSTNCSALAHLRISPSSSGERMATLGGLIAFCACALDLRRTSSAICQKMSERTTGSHRT